MNKPQNWVCVDITVAAVCAELRNVSQLAVLLVLASPSSLPQGQTSSSKTKTFPPASPPA